MNTTFDIGDIVRIGPHYGYVSAVSKKSKNLIWVIWFDKDGAVPYSTHSEPPFFLFSKAIE